MSLTVTGLAFSYPGKAVLRGVDTGVLPAGRLTALLGPNAAGKSTLFRCIAGLLTPHAGQLRLGEQDLAAMTTAERIRAVCYMPQGYQVSAALTVFEVVLMARKHLEDWRVRDSDLSVVEQTLGRCGIAHLAQRHLGELSGGQQQMVAFAQAMVREARVVLLDEPTSALDLRHQLEVMGTLRTLTRERQTISVAAMHDLSLAARFADHLVLMREGRVLTSGPTASVLASPLLAETYGVTIELGRSSGGHVLVGACLPAGSPSIETGFLPR